MSKQRKGNSTSSRSGEVREGRGRGGRGGRGGKGREGEGKGGRRGECTSSTTTAESLTQLCRFICTIFDLQKWRPCTAVRAAVLENGLFEVKCMSSTTGHCVPSASQSSFEFSNVRRSTDQYQLVKSNTCHVSWAGSTLPFNGASWHGCFGIFWQC